MEATPEMHEAVKRDVCRMHGHTFSEVVKVGSLAPQQVVCFNCGASWRIHPEDLGHNFGHQSP